MAVADNIGIQMKGKELTQTFRTIKLEKTMVYIKIFQRCKG